MWFEKSISDFQDSYDVTITKLEFHLIGSVIDNLKDKQVFLRFPFNFFAPFPDDVAADSDWVSAYSALVSA
jgi:hypothetical protein